MPTYDLFGNPVFSKEEKESEKKKTEEEAKKKKAEADKIAKAQKAFEDFKESESNSLKSVIKHIKEVDVNAVKTDIELIKHAATQEEVNIIKKKYLKQIVEADKIAKAEEEAKKNPKYIYPFILHYAGNNIDTSMMFENGKEYTTEEIRTKMLQNQYYEFSGKVTFEYLKSDNVLLPIFEQHKKG